MQRSKHRLLVVAAAAVIPQLGLSPAAHAANVTWDGGGADNNLGTAANWSADALPASTDSVFFAGSVRTTPNAAANAQYLALFFGAGAAPFNITGTGAITLGSATAGNYLNNDDVAVTQTISTPINFIGGTVNATQGNLVFNAPFNVGNNANAVSGNNVTFFTGLGNTTLAGGIAGAGTASSTGGSITKTGTGTLLLTADSSAWAGNVFVNGGSLRITNANALGSGGGRIETALTSGGTGLGTLELDGSAAPGGGFTLAKSVTTRARQAATINEVSIRNVSGNNTISNVLTGSGGSQFNYEAAGGSLTINTWDTSAVSTYRTLRLLGASNGQINNWTPNATPATANIVTVIKDGTGTWTLGAGMNTTAAAFGPMTVNAGNLTLAPGLGAHVVGVAGTTAAVRPDVTINNGGTLTVLAANGSDGEVGNATTPGILTLKSGGTLDASTFSTYSLQVAQTFIAGGTFKAGTLAAFGDNAIHIGDSTASTAVGTLSLQGNLSLSHAYATSTGGLYFNLGNSTTPGSGVNDLISVQGDLQIDNSSGPIDVRLTPLASGLTNGIYRLINYTTGTTLDPSNFNLLGFTAGTTRQSASITTAPGQVNLSVVGNPANLVWKGDGSANTWDSATTANFLNGATPDKFYPFDNATFDDTSANKTVSLSGSLVLGSATVNTASTYIFTGSGSLDGGGTLAKSGTGTLILANTGPNTYTGGTTINAGTLQVGTGGTDGSLGAGPIVNNGSLVINKSADVTLGVVSGSGSLTQTGTGNLILASANTYTGATSIQAGTVQASNASAFGDPAAGTTVSPGATIYFLAPASTYNEPFTVSGDGTAAGIGALRAGSAVVTTLAAPVTFTGPTTFDADGGATLTVTGPLTGTGDLTKTGPGAMNVTNVASAWTGNTNVNAGTLELGTTGVSLNLPAGTVAVASGATLAFGNSQPASFTGTVTGAGVILQDSAGGTTTLAGNLTGFTGTLSTGNFGSPSTLNVAVPTGATTARVWDSNNGGGSNQNGVGFGILRLTNSNALAPNATIDIQVAQAAGTGRLELGNNVTINAGTISLAQRSNTSATIESTDGVNTLSGTATISTGGTTVNLQVDAGSTFNVQGIIQPLATAASPRNLTLQGAGIGNVSAVIQNNTQLVNVTKSGAGTWTLSGSNTYTGTTTVAGGKLVLAPAAYTPVTTGAGGAIVNAGRLVFDYTASSSPAATVVPLLTSAAASNFSTGQIRSTTTDATHTLGYYDDGASKLTVMYTYYGDLNLDGRINADDYALLDRGFAKHLTGWSNGDVNYDGIIDATDYLKTDTAFGQQSGTLSPAFLAERQSEFGDAYVSQLIAAVPEPTSLSLLGFAALPRLSRRRRK